MNFLPEWAGIWFFPGASVCKMQDGCFAVGDRAVCKCYADKGALLRELHLAGFLLDHAIPVPRTFLTVGGWELAAKENGFWHMMHRLPGAHPCPLDQPARYGRRFGEMLRRLHDTLAAYPQAARFPQNDFLAESNGWVKERFPAEQTSARVIWENALDTLGRLSPTLPRQLIHRDLHVGNLLFEGDTWTGLLDLELCRVDYRIFDAAYLALSLIYDLYENPQAVAAWREWIAAFFAAYDATDVERAAFGPMMLAIEGLFLAYHPGAAEQTARMLEWLENELKTPSIGSSQT